ncbi:MAG TPA: hypothetical protein PKA88_05935 [Polyangiaceae bacterium]|nr:hypothetical protein [Polyangiaceae bacterium]HMR75397.1 hypothetical protein [Polyangiaceae bacterium]
MTISPINAPPTLGGFNPDSLSAEALMTYCQTQLSDIDSDVKSYFEQQKKMLAQKTVLSELKNSLSKFSPPKTEAQWQAVAEAYSKAINALEEIDPGGELSMDLQHEFWGNLGPKVEGAAQKKGIEFIDKYGLNPKGIDYNSIDFAKIATKEWWTGHVGDMSSKVDAVSGNAELNMIQLQSLMSKRQTAVQLTTNMLSKYDQTIASIVNNVK